MEDAKPAEVSLRSDEGGAMEARFADLCKNKLALDESIARQAMVFFRESKHILLANMSAIGSGSPEEVERFWSAFVVYCVTRLSRGKEKEKKEEESGGVTLCQILRAFKLNVVDFFKEMPQLSLKAGYILTGLYGSGWEKRLELKELQTNFVHLSLLSRHYRRAYLDFFIGESRNGQDSTDSSSLGFVSDYHRFGWLLFLALRTHAFSRFKDLVTCTNGLVSILAILVLHVPVRFRTFKIQDSKLLTVKSDEGVNLLASLCNIYQTSEDELRSTMEKVNNLIVEILKKKPCPASECKIENLDNIITDDLVFFEDLLDESSLNSDLRLLENHYDDVIHISGELDERMFINEEDSLLGTGSLSGGAINMSSRKQKSNPNASPAKSPMRSPVSPINSNLSGNRMMVTNTPVSIAMTTAKWLRDVISPLPSKPSAGLQRFLTSCDRDLTADVSRRANIILGAIFPSSSLGGSTSGSLQCANLMDSIWAEQRKMEATKLYYRVLEAMCRAESHILNSNNLTSLLTNERFHRCMLACSAELVLATHKTVTMMFPAVLEKTGITAFDLSKVIESFVRHEETLPRELKRHLNTLEERLLESMAWEKGSSMYNSLTVARPELSAEINRLGLLAEPMPSLDDMAMHYNISSGGLPPLPTRKRDPIADEVGDPQTPKKQCNERRNVLVERNSFTSPVKERLLTFNGLKLKLPPLQSAFASPTRPNPAGGGETCAETGINLFFSKIVKLAAIRIRSLCERLQLSQQSLERIYCLIQQIINQQTPLFFNRHIDQLILCSFYGVAKISHLTLTFKEIIYHYRKQPQCKSQVFRSVFVSWPSTSRNGKVGQDHIDIITFYNEVFIPSVKPLLVELASTGVAQEDKRPTEDRNNADRQLPGSPRFSPFPNLPDMSPKKVSALHNVYVSPLRSSKMDALLSPSSKSYYACVGESTHAFQSPSKDLTAINNRLNSGRKINAKLNFDLVSDSVVAGSLDHMNDNHLSSPASAISKIQVKREQPES
ncbi:retinoblastoma-related protein isoform X1 [Iris pallida]|uniref:Retinoblastoma-related protein isoform X1 n=1 Tax=Iris pallida TaxID=29817 RepID=A0AAX6I3T8_IRIPA|nr:retinoblastoma-related protein isoform X1 [Iris pallida]